ncbi:MAG: T9SS type A sorting domain-containing protein [Bacteroidetes bacterium]|nr:T9SS type A sorting domain-containing protein [Bacteroidota bacterium]
MKAILIVLSFFLLCFTSISAQTVLKPQPLSSLTYHGSTLSLDDTTIWAPRTQQHFLMGWQWAGPNINTNKRLHCNFYQSHYGYNDTRKYGFKEIPDSGGVKYLVWQHLRRPDADDIWALGSERGMIFDPVANADGTVRVGDTTGAVLGFTTRNMTYGSLNNSGENFDRFSLDTTISFSASERDTGKIVLDNPVIDNNYYQWGGVYDGRNDTVTNNWSGRRWYISLNLRRTSTFDLAMSKDTLLTINIPYILNDTNIKGFVVFDSVSIDSSSHAYSLSNGRGKILAPKYKVGGTNKFVITRNMLPVGSNRDITVSAFFRVKNLFDTLAPNPWLPGTALPTDSTPFITKIGLTVRYHGRNKVSIDWLRIATPAFERMMYGSTDSSIWEYTRHTLSLLRDAITKSDTVINGVDTTITPPHPYFRLMSFYGVDEVPQLYYAAMRYYRDLYDGRLISEAQVSSNSASPMNMQNTWLGGSTGAEYFYVPTPIVRYGSFGNKYVFHTKWGYDNTEYRSGYIGSSYETYLSYKAGKGDTADNAYYKKHLIDSVLSTNVTNAGELGSYEGAIRGNFYLNNFAYADKPWWTNIWGTSGFAETWAQNESDRDMIFKYKKPLTGEEMRSQIWTPILHGCKGIMYDRMYLDTLQLTQDTVIRYDNAHNPIDTTIYCDTCSSTYGVEKTKFQGMMNAPSQIPDSLEGTSLIESDIAGSDFLRNGDPTHFDLILNLDTVAYNMGVPQGRVYWGRKSMRREVMKAHDFILANDSILMKMKLVSWFGKGFYIFKTGDSTTFNKFVALDTSRFATRPPYRTRYDSIAQKTVPYYEDSDSTFYDVMLHRLGTAPLDSVFILGVMNRHTSPLLVGYDSVHSKDTAYFITTAEFDSTVQWHPEKKYIQAGAREITVPFNYKDTNGRYALLRVRELSGTLDTIIGQDSRLSLKYLPGEGKLFKVEILRPNEVAGNLAHSNQTKIVAHAKMKRPDNDSTGAWIESDTIVHYMVYHKPVPNDTAKLGVFFRKSKPATKYMNTAALQWDNTEYWLSQYILHDSLLSFCDTCAFPSIVTRFDSTSLEYRSYVVYGCKSDSTVQSYLQQYIVESVVRVKNDTVFTFTRPGLEQFGFVLDSLDNRDLSEWGTPMVNASDTANFYCWSNPTLGIVAGWKKPDSIPRELVSKGGLHWTVIDTVAECTQVVAQHPSMNPYSRYIRGEHESDCALVWQEKNNCGINSPQIFYTRLRIDTIGGSHITYGLSPKYGADPGSPAVFNADQSIVCVSTTNPIGDLTKYSYPVVYRELFHADRNSSDCNFDYWYPGHTPNDVRFDGVYYQKLLSLLPSFAYASSVITTRWIWQRDTVVNGTFIPDTLRVGYIGTIWSETNKYLDQPVISAGEAAYYTLMTGNWVGCVNYSDRVMNLNFRSRPQKIDSVPNSTPKIYFIVLKDSLGQILHLPQTHQYPHDPYIPVSIVDCGYVSNAHLAERGTLQLNDWQRNHRIYNRVIPSPPAKPIIRSSGQYFFRTTAIEPKGLQFHCFGEDTVSFGVSSVVVGQREYPLKSRPLLSPSIVLKSPDTLSTDWFNVDNIETLDVITTGSSPDRMGVWLERESDGATYDVPLTAGEYIKINRETVELINGDDENYRLRICSQGYSPYHSETAITEIEEETGYGKTSGKDYKHIDLGRTTPSQTVFIYPNPAREEVNLTIKGDKRSEVIIVSAVGGEATRFSAEGGKTVTVNTSTFPSGMYVVRVRRDGIADAVVPFVIVR